MPVDDGKPPKLVELRNAVAESLASSVKAYDLPDVCLSYGLERGDESEAFRSKRSYVLVRVGHHSLAQVAELAMRVVEDYGGDTLDELVRRLTAQNVSGEFRNLIFAANGPKPRLVLRDAVNNTIEIVENEQYCLIYDRPLAPHGLSWRELVSWWATKTTGLPDELSTARNLYDRLFASLASPPEQLLLHTYCTRYRSPLGFDLPALIPQVYLHYDPYTRQQLATHPGELKRQRMDFLMLLPHHSRIVIEVDGAQHYSKGDRPDPRRYSEMVAEDRKLRLAGYEVYRFGGEELSLADAPQVATEFFDKLLKRHGVVKEL